jgi:hypothetical protein
MRATREIARPFGAPLKTVALFTVLLVAVGCQSAKYTRAEITVGTLDHKQNLTVTDAKEIQRLLDTLPGLGTGSPATITATWIPSIVIAFYRSDNTSEHVESDGNFWMDGRGHMADAHALVAEVRHLMNTAGITSTTAWPAAQH